MHFPETQILEWFTQLCFALKCIHGQNILHRDLKTQNIFLGKDDVIKLGDFGIARMLNSTLDHAQTTVGTPYYLSPEICQKKPYNHKSDMWSLGCVLYELVTLKHAFNANNFSSLVIKILQGQYPPVPRHYGPLLEDLVSVLLQKNPDDRPSAKQLLYVPAMQPYVKKFLQCERDRMNSVASDITEITSRSTHECSQILSPGKTEKKCLQENVAEESYSLHQGEEIQMKQSQVLKQPQQISSRKQGLSSARTLRPRENEPARVDAPKKQELPDTNNASKMHQPPSVNGNTPNARENVLTRLPVDARKYNLIRLAHALQRRHSEHIFTPSEPRNKISKVRIHSSGALFVNHSAPEDDVFSVSESTTVADRKPDRCIGTKPRDVKERGSSKAVNCRSRVNSITQKRKTEPVMEMDQSKSDEDMCRKRRNQSAVTTHDRNRRPFKQRHRRLTTNLETNEEDKENRSSMFSNAQVKAKGCASSGALRQIQSRNIESLPMTKETKEIFGQKNESSKSTYTVCKERKPSVFEIPDIDERQFCYSANTKEKDFSNQDNDGNEGTILKSERRLSSVTNEQTDLNDRNFETVVQTVPEAVTYKTERDDSFSTSQWKFKHGGKTLHLDSVSSNDSIYSHMEALRLYLEKELGTRLLTAVYRYLVHVSLEDNEMVRKGAMAMLGEDKMTYFPVLLQLVTCEAIYFRAS